MTILLTAFAEQRFREFADSMPHILWCAEPNGSLDYVNKVYTDYTGINFDIARQNWLNVVHPDDVDLCTAAWTEAIITGNVYSIEFRIIHIETKEYRWQAVTAKPVKDETGRIVKWYGIATDIHDRKIANERANLLAKRLDTTIESMSDGFMMMDRSWRLIYINRTIENLLKRSRSELLGKVLWTEYEQLLDTSLYRECHKAAQEKCAIEFECFSVLFNQWFECKIYPSEDVVSVYLRDISNRKASEAEIRRLAFYDQLSGLPNRQLFRDRLEHAMLMNKLNSHLGAVMFIDIDNFKALNDAQGHHKGDQLLKQLAQRLASCVRKIDTVGRLGGDEFLVLIEQLSSDPLAAATQAEMIAEKIRTTLSQPCDLDGHQYIATASIGVTLMDNQISNIDELLKRTDTAMYRAKATGRNAICFYDPAMQTAINAKMALEKGLRESIHNSMFTLHYQPQLDRERRIIGVEALVRCLHPEYKNVSPSTFIPIAEETGLILQLGHWVLKTACSQLVEWSKESHTAQLSLSVNVSAHQFHNSGFVNDVLEVVHETGANPEKLKLELTETALVKDIEDAVIKMKALEKHGIKFSLDDFGTGYSSLSYLRYLPLEQLKIDRSFISRIPDNANDAAIVQAIIAMSHSLGLTVIAEGVETEQQIKFLAQYHCNAYQGFLFFKPMTVEELTSYLRMEKKMSM